MENWAAVSTGAYLLLTFVPTVGQSPYLRFSGDANEILAAFIRDPENLGGISVFDGRQPCTDASADHCLDLGGGWLRRCLSEHGPAHKKSTASSGRLAVPEWPLTASTFRPTRTINVGDQDATTTDPFLEIHDHLPNDILKPPLSWAALSHCWGGNTRFILTANNLAHWQQTISLSSMPNTFRDAVTVTRKLGIRHLWIDSICILQDSKQDWEREADRMADVYRRSTVHIATHTSRHCDDGFLKARDACEYVELPFESHRSGIAGSILVRRGLARWNTALFTAPHSILATRAWVLQESLLAPRTLHFGSEQIFWECPNLCIAEGEFSPRTFRGDTPQEGAVGFDLNATKRHLSLTMGTSPPGIDYGNSGEPRMKKARIHSEDWYVRWYQIVTNYSQRNLGYPSDIFPALSGLAKTIQPLISRSDEEYYMAGLFSGDIHRGLLWMVDAEGMSESQATASRAQPYRAPTWSWASIIGPIKFANRPGEEQPEPTLEGETVKVVGVSLRSADGPKNVSEGVYGALSGASLEVEGLWRWGTSLDRVKLAKDGEKFWAGFESKLILVEENVRAEAELQLDIESDGIDTLGPGEWALLQISEWAQDDPIVVLLSLYALVLRPTEVSGKTMFRRVGLVKFTGIDESSEVVQFQWERKRVTLI